MGTKIYMQFGDIKGDVTEPSHKNWIEIQSCDYSSERSIKQETGSMSRSVSKPSVSSLKISKLMNISTQKIFFESHSGNGTDVCTIHFVDDKGTFMEYKLHKAILSDYHVSAIAGSERPHENFRIHFTVIDTRYTPTESVGSASSAGFDVQKGQCL